MIGQGRWGCEGMGGALVGKRHAHRAWGRTEAQGAVIEASVTNWGEARGRAFVELVVASEGVPPRAAATTRVGH